MLTIREERKEDIPGIRRVLEAAFQSRFEAKLVDALRTAGVLTLSLVALEDERVIGHIAFSPVVFESVIAKANGLGLAPLAVVPDRQRRGIGKELVRRGLKECKWRGYRLVVVVGAPGFYQQFQFTAGTGSFNQTLLIKLWAISDYRYFVCRQRALS
jgi:putative acetyltransferase